MAARGENKLARAESEAEAPLGGTVEHGDIFSQILAFEPKLPKAQRAVARAIPRSLWQSRSRIWSPGSACRRPP